MAIDVEGSSVLARGLAGVNCASGDFSFTGGCFSSAGQINSDGGFTPTTASEGGIEVTIAGKVPAPAATGRSSTFTFINNPSLTTCRFPTERVDFVALPLAPVHAT